MTANDLLARLQSSDPLWAGGAAHEAANAIEALTRERDQWIAEHNLMAQKWSEAESNRFIAERQRDEALALLCEILEDNDTCPSCGRLYRSMWTDGHDPTCRLAALLERTR